MLLAKETLTHESMIIIWLTQVANVAQQFSLGVSLFEAPSADAPEEAACKAPQILQLPDADEVVGHDLANNGPHALDEAVIGL